MKYNTKGNTCCFLPALCARFARALNLSVEWSYNHYMHESRISDVAPASSAMATEAGEAASVAAAQLEWWSSNSDKVCRAIERCNPQQVVTCARGSSDHAATFAKYQIETAMRIPVVSHSPSLSSIYGVQYQKFERTLFLAISQSGQSSDLLISAQAAKDNGALVCVLVNDESSLLAQLADLTIPQLAGEETSVAATKTYIASLFALVLMTGYWGKDTKSVVAAKQMPELLETAWSQDWSAGVSAIATARNMFIIGRGPTYGIAQEAALKLKETCGIHAEAFSAAEVRHGPMELVGRDFPVLIFVPADAAASGFAELAEEFAARGANVIAAGADYAGTAKLPTYPAIHPALSAICMIQSFYKMASQISAVRGLDPDRPAYLQKITNTL